MDTSIKQKIQKRLEDDRKKFEKHLVTIDDLSKHIDEILYVVKLHCLWSKEGGQNSEATAADLKTAMLGAISEYKRINHRSDVQADVRAYAKFPVHYGYELFLPEDIWKSIWDSLKEERGYK